LLYLYDFSEVYALAITLKTLYHIFKGKQNGHFFIYMN